ncbi:MAG: hypothetical protein IJU52_02420 [Clostridia bacterium]|nr:hypothetical protein [Clostridia bacterium]
MDRYTQSQNKVPINPQQQPAGQTAVLKVRVSSGYGIFPIEGALVTVFGEEESAQNVVAQSFTGRDGATPDMVITLTNRSSEGALTPVRNAYTVETSKEGYQTSVVQNVLLYASVETVLAVNLASLPDRPGAALSKYDREIISGGDGEK